MESYKYEINGIEFTMTRPLTDEEMRAMANNYPTSYEQIGGFTRQLTNEELEFLAKGLNYDFKA